MEQLASGTAGNLVQVTRLLKVLVLAEKEVPARPVADGGDAYYRATDGIIVRLRAVVAITVDSVRSAMERRSEK